MAPLGALRQRRDHGGAGRHVDPRGQGFGGKDHLDQALLEQLFDQLLPCRQHPGVVGRNAAQQGIGMAPIAHSLGGGGDVGIEACLDASLLLRVHQAGLTQVANPLVAAPAAEDEIDGRKHVALSHLGHHKAQGRGFGLGRLGRFRAFALAALRGPPHLAIGMQPRAFVVE